MKKPLTILEKRALGKLKKSNTNPNSTNPYRETIEVEDKRTGKIKIKTRDRPVPKGLTSNDAKILKRVRRKAYRYDMSFSCCCGFKFGWSSIIGLLPVIGDFIDFFMALLLIRTASKVDGGLPKRLYAMMMANILWDLAFGFIPVIGDLVDMWNKANTRNAWLLDAYLEEKGKALLAIQEKARKEGTRVPSELPMSLGDEEMEVGVESARVFRPPPPVTPARQPTASRGNMAPAPQRPMTPGRNLTGGRQARRDPRD